MKEMEVIKEGQDYDVKFVCPSCAAVFQESITQCVNMEHVPFFGSNKITSICKCPNCNYEVRTYHKGVK